MNGVTDAWRMHVIAFHKDVARASDKEANARIVPGGRLLHFWLDVQYNGLHACYQATLHCYFRLLVFFLPITPFTRSVNEPLTSRRSGFTPFFCGNKVHCLQVCYFPTRQLQILVPARS